MGFFQNPIKGNGPYERYKVEAIERDKKGRESFGELLKEEQKKPYFLFSVIQKFYDKVIRLLSSDTGLICENLSCIQRVFQIMQEEDRSQDSELLSDLAIFWAKAHEDLLFFRKKSSEYVMFKNWLGKIDSYPGSQEFTLGYYLAERAGQVWLPFPYMDLIQKLHSQHHKNSTESILAEWIFSLQALIALLQAD